MSGTAVRRWIRIASTGSCHVHTLTAHTIKLPIPISLPPGQSAVRGRVNAKHCCPAPTAFRSAPLAPAGTRCIGTAPHNSVGVETQNATTGEEIASLGKATWNVIREVFIGRAQDAPQTGKKETLPDANDSAEQKGGVEGVNSDKALLDSTQSNLSTSDAVKRILQLVAPERNILALAVSTIVLTTPMSLFFPAAVGTLLDLSTSSSAVMSPWTVSAALLAVFTSQGVLMSTRDALLAVAGERMGARLRSLTFASIVRQETAFFDTTRTGELINRLSSDTQVVQKALTNNVTSTLRAAGMVVGGTGMLIYTSPKLALVSLLVLPPGAAIAVYLGRFMKRKQAEVQDALGEAAQKAEEVLGSMRTVRQFVREPQEVASFNTMTDHTRRLATSVGIASALLGTSIHVCANVSMALVLGYGGTLVLGGEMSAGGLTSFLLYSVYVGFNFGSLSTVYGDLMKAVGASQRIFAIMDRVPEMPPYDLPRGVAGRELPAFRGAITFEEVEFAYPNRDDLTVLQGFSLHINPGQVIGIVGGSGSGKSTVIQLLSRLYDPKEGKVYFDGVDLRELDPSWIRSVVATVPQEPVLFAGSIADNIRYGRLEATDAEVREAARVANAHEFTERFPAGYQTFVGERGVQLSGGQKQRIAIARAVLKDPRVLLLDEATSALDSESEGLVSEALERVAEGRTVLKIAHRLNTVKESDSIAVIQGGKVVEYGHADELLAQRGVFHKLVNSQTF